MTKRRILAVPALVLMTLAADAVAQRRSGERRCARSDGWRTPSSLRAPRSSRRGSGPPDRPDGIDVI